MEGDTDCSCQIPSCQLQPNLPRLPSPSLSLRTKAIELINRREAYSPQGLLSVARWFVEKNLEGIIGLIQPQRDFVHIHTRSVTYFKEIFPQRKKEICVWQRDWVRGLDPRAPTFISPRFVQDKPFKEFQLLSIDQSGQIPKQLKWLKTEKIQIFFNISMPCHSKTNSSIKRW